MRSDLLLACISGPLLAVFLLKGKARWLLAAIFGGMLAAFFAGSISGFLAGLVSYDAMAAVLYISPAVEEGLKLILFLLFFFVSQNGRKPFEECKGRRELDCDTDGWSRYESRT